jgi:rRNA maturation endonuclease Nob1
MEDKTHKRCPKCAVTIPDPDQALVACPTCGGPLLIPHVFVLKPGILGAVGQK